MHLTGAGRRTTWIIAIMAALFMLSYASPAMAFYAGQAPVIDFSQSSGQISHPTYIVFSSGSMWVSTNAGVMNFAPEAGGTIYQNENAAPPTGFTMGPSCNYQGLAFDSSGNLWVAIAQNSKCSSALEEFSPPFSGSSSPVTTISTGLNLPEGIMFDPSGNLWVANTGAATVTEYAKSGGSISTSPTLTLQGFSVPNDVAFGSSGSLWVSDSGSKAVYGFSAASIAGLTGTHTLSATTTLSLPSSVSIYGIQFDGNGNLWIADQGGGSNNGVIYEFSPPFSGSSVPALSLTGGSSALKNPISIGFDSFGSLWAVNTGSGKIAEFANLQLGPNGGTSGSSVTLNGGGLSPNTAYDYCYEVSGESSPPAACSSGSPSFTSTASGSVPSGTTLANTYGSGWVVISTGSTIIAASYFTVGTASVTISPPSGNVGGSVTVTGSGFAASSTIQVSYDGASMTTSPSSCTSDATGAFSCSFTVPESGGGQNTVSVTDGSTAISGHFTVTPSFSINPTSGTTPTTITATGHGFAAGSSVTISYGGTGETTSPSPCFTGASGTPTAGEFSCTFTAPASSGSKTVQAGDGVNTLSATFDATSATTTTVSCIPATIATGASATSTTCTATVTGSSPTGTVTWSSSSAGTFSSTTCNLSSGSCSVTYEVTSTVASPGTQTITGAYGGDSSNSASSGTAAANLLASTSVSVSCSPPTQTAGSSITCTATASGDSPTGTVTFSSATGSFSPANGQCALSSGSCSVTYTDPSAGSPTITASYGGDASNSPSAGTSSPTFSPGPSVSLSPPSGPGGTSVAVTGSGYSPDTAYSYCFESGVMSPSSVSCTAGTIGTFTTDGSGNMPSQPLTIPPGSSTGLVIVYSGSTAVGHQAFTVSSGAGGTAACGVSSSSLSLAYGVQMASSSLGLPLLLLFAALTRKRRKAISPILAVIVLIAITIAGGLLIYSTFFSSAGVAGKSTQITVTYASLETVSGGSTFALQIKNTGSVPLQAISATLNGNSLLVPSTCILDPGQSAALIWNTEGGSLPGTYVIGDSYALQVAASSPGGSQAAVSITVAAQE